MSACLVVAKSPRQARALITLPSVHARTAMMQLVLRYASSHCNMLMCR